MLLWNTLTGQKEKFTAGKEVKLYVCGITPYATTHLGHARIYTFFDVLVRVLDRQQLAVRYTQNVTDVDDPLYKKARESGRRSADLALEFTRVFQDDMAALGVRPPDFFPRASDEILEMQRLIAVMLEKGHAYQRGNHVYYRIDSFPRYGQLSKLDRAQMRVLSSEQGEDPADPCKEDPLDFKLWKPSLPDEDSWPSPWGPGRPGWHIEDSAMALKYLGPQLDIHGGGSDLIFPHHENEIAQSEACTGILPFARFWLHVEMVLLGGVKMSKSLGNLVLVRDLLPRFGAKSLRHYLLSTHYRAPLDYSEVGLRASLERVERLNLAAQSDDREVDPATMAACRGRFDQALADDLDTPIALETLDALAQAVLAAPAGTANAKSVSALKNMAHQLGLDVPSTSAIISR